MMRSQHNQENNKIWELQQLITLHIDDENKLINAYVHILNLPEDELNKIVENEQRMLVDAGSDNDFNKDFTDNVGVVLDWLKKNFVTDATAQCYVLRLVCLENLNRLNRLDYPNKPDIEWMTKQADVLQVRMLEIRSDQLNKIKIMGKLIGTINNANHHSFVIRAMVHVLAVSLVLSILYLHSCHAGKDDNTEDNTEFYKQFLLKIFGFLPFLAALGVVLKIIHRGATFFSMPRGTLIGSEYFQPPSQVSSDKPSNPSPDSDIDTHKKDETETTGLRRRLT